MKASVCRLEKTAHPMGHKTSDPNSRWAVAELWKRETPKGAPTCWSKYDIFIQMNQDTTNSNDELYKTGMMQNSNDDFYIGKK